MNLIEELYFGNISPNGRIPENDPDYQKAMAKLQEKEDTLMGALRGEDKKDFIDLLNAQSAIIGVGSVAHFVSGFQLGARLIKDVLCREPEGLLK